MQQITGLFPTPFMRVEKLLSPRLVASLLEEFNGVDKALNVQSAQLSHTEILPPESSPNLIETAALIGPRLVEFGGLLFGENLRWAIKEMWVNVLQTGGRQSIHNHANSFVSGVIYLTRSHPSASTVFLKGLGGNDFVFNNTHGNARMGPFNADKWIMPEAFPGDMVLFPSYLLHEVPVNQGELRISIAFNSMPEKLDSWGYGISFSK